MIHLPVDHFYPPQVFSWHGNVVVDVARHLLVLWGHGGGDVVRVECSMRHAVNQLDQFQVRPLAQLILTLLFQNTVTIDVPGVPINNPSYIVIIVFSFQHLPRSRALEGQPCQL